MLHEWRCFTQKPGFTSKTQKCWLLAFSVGDQRDKIGSAHVKKKKKHSCKDNVMINEYIYILYLANVKMVMIKFTVKCKFKKNKFEADSCLYK